MIRTALFFALSGHIRFEAYIDSREDSLASYKVRTRPDFSVTSRGKSEVELIEQSETLELVHESGNWLLSREKGFSPVQLVTASAAACSTYVFEELMSRYQIPCRLIRVLFDYLEDPVYPNPVSQIHVFFYLQAEESQYEAIRKTFLEIPGNCPVIQSLHPRVQVDESIIFVDA